MPTVQYQPDQVRTQVQGTVQARAVDNGGQQLAQGINSLAQMAGEMNKQATIAETQQAANGFERDKNKLFFDPENGYFNTAGRTAYDTAGETSKRLEQLKTDYGKNLSPLAQAEFNRVADSQLRSAETDIMRHSSKNLKAWQQSNIAAEVENSLESGALYWNNMKQLNVQRELGRQGVLESAKMQGMSADATNEKLQNFNSAFAMKLYGDALEGPDKVNMSEMLDKRRGVEETKDKAGEAVLRSNTLVSTYGDRADARGAMLEEINKIKDPEMQKMVKSEASYQLDQKFRADGERRANIVTQAEEFIFERGNSVEQFKAQFAAEWDDLTVPMRASLTKQTPIKTDQVKYGELVLMDDKELAKVDPADHRHYLDNADYESFVRLVKSARGEVRDSTEANFTLQAARTNGATATSGVETVLGKKKGQWNDDDREMANAVYQLITSNVGVLQEQKGGKLTPLEYTEAVNKITLSHFVDDTFFGFKTKTELTLEDVPIEDIRAITRKLREAGQIAASPVIIQMYQDQLAKRENK